MRVFVGLLLLLVLAVQTGCGTARAIVGDYDPDIVVEAIRPTAGVSGETVTFEALVCEEAGSVTPTFQWDFGGAAFPSTSFETSPQVTLRNGAAAPYNASLTLSGGCLGENVRVVTPFTIAVDPLTVLAVTGTTGIVGKAGTLSVVVGTGVATDYAWDFGGAASPSGSTADSPSITFTDVPGVYNARVIVSNNFEATEFLFTITVV